MKSCLEGQDIQEMGESMASDFDRRIALIPESLCGPFNAEARDLETKLLAIHQMAARMARKLDDLGEVAALWGCVVRTCDVFAKSLNALHSKHPGCGADLYYDRVLDLRNRCLRLQQMHS